MEFEGDGAVEGVVSMGSLPKPCLRLSRLMAMVEGKRIAGQGKCCRLDDKNQCKTSLAGLCAMAVLYLPTEKDIECY